MTVETKQLDMLVEFSKLEELPPMLSISNIAFLPIFPDELASVPMHVARSGVFGPSGEDDGGRYYHDAPFYKDDKIVLKFSGHSLNQDDADVFMAVLRLTKGGKAGMDGRIRTMRAYLVDELGWPRSGKNYGRLLSSLKRLTESLFYYETLNKDSSAPVERSKPLRMFEYDQNGDYLMLWIPKESMMLFEHNGFLNWEKRLSIAPRNGLAKAIQLYTAGLVDVKEVRMPLSELKVITRSKSPESKYRISVQRAFEELERVNVLENTWIRKESGDWYCGWMIK